MRAGQSHLPCRIRSLGERGGMNGCPVVRVGGPVGRH
uniref:Uncharacterized protein n=1 Tax=Anguilla anguilla TaxID=7936 RepID=A0A0E9PJ66_ANGAN